MNKWCGYAEFMKDVKKGQNGFERIKIDKFTESLYMGYVKESPSYNGSCPAADFSK